MEKIYKELYEGNLKWISAEVFKNHLVFDGVNKVDIDEYNEFIEKTITEILSSKDDFSEDTKTRFVFRTLTIPYNIMRKYNKSDGRGIWGVIESKNYRYEIVRAKDHKNNPTFNKTKRVKHRKDLEAASTSV